METDEQPIKKVALTIPFNSNHHSLLVAEVLYVDKELKGSGIHRNISFRDSDLLVTFEGSNYKKLRVAVNAFLKNVILIIKTTNLFN